MDPWTQTPKDSDSEDVPNVNEDKKTEDRKSELDDERAVATVYSSRDFVFHSELQNGSLLEKKTVMLLYLQDKRRKHLMKLYKFEMISPRKQ